MQKAAENLKQQQMASEQERQKVLSSRIVAIPDVDSIEDKGAQIARLPWSTNATFRPAREDLQRSLFAHDQARGGEVRHQLPGRVQGR